MRRLTSGRRRDGREGLWADRFSQRIPDFNLRPLGLSDLYKECERREIFADEIPLRRIHGCSFQDEDGQPCLLVNSLIAEPYRVVAGYHELAHLLDHPPDPGVLLSTGSLWNQSKAEFQAQAVGVVALIPRELIESFDFGELAEEYGFPRDLIMFRAQIRRQFRF
jgi:Zn-dependent peptidase ImmA (M78 family)